MENRLDRDYSAAGLLGFALPTVIMMIFTSLYTIVDGIFIARLVGEDALAAANIVFPCLCAVMAVGIMLSTGGSAAVARKMGEGDEEGARRDFTFLTLAGVSAGAVFFLLGLLAPEALSRLLGASPALLPHCTVYLRVQLLFAPAAMLQFLFQSFFVAAGRPGLGLGLTVAAGVTNGVLDVVFMGPMKLGILGAALGTVSGYLIPAVCGLAFFALRRQGLRFVPTRPRWRVLGKSCANGSSEMVTNLAAAVVTFLFNSIMMTYAGETGVAAITIVLYAQFLLTALYLGFSMGVAPLISFAYGAENRRRLRRLFSRCMVFLLAGSVGIFALALALAGGIVGLFSPAGSAVNALALEGFRLFSPTFLFAGVNIFASAFFTALSDGRTSAIVSFARTFGFLTAGLLLLPRLMGVAGVWLAVPAAEALCLGLSLFFLWRYRGVYGADGPR